MHPVSILFLETASSHEHLLPGEDPPYFTDLAIDRILEAVSAGFEPYDLRPLFRFIPHDRTTIDYRQEVLRDFSDNTINTLVKDFTTAMVHVRARLEHARKCFNKHQEAAVFLGAITGCCESVQVLAAGLAAAGPQSEGMRALSAAVHEYADSISFKFLAEEALRHRTALDAIRYTVLLHESTVTVREFEEAPDYNATIAQLFARFQQQDTSPRNTGVDMGMGNVQSQILDGVAYLNPEVFAALSTFVNGHRDFITPALTRFEREAQFYLSWLAFTYMLAATGLTFSWPQLIDDHDIGAEAAFDLALAEKLHGGGKIVTNDFYLEGAERIFIVTGPNQGGKTTFARMLGQMHFFANLGLTVPGRQVRLKFFDRIFTHFEREESLTALHGKLYDDLLRIHAILDFATADSLIILNEIFNSTALKDALFLADAVLRSVIGLGAVAVCVTFMDELASIGPETVSVTSMVEPENPERRSFRIIRHQADGLAYALSIARKYGVTYDRLKERLG